jgi:arylsulfatase A-like enzyme
LRALRDSPRWEDTVVVFLSDHGEQFREHGGLYHNHSLFDEELRVPGFLVAGAHVLTDAERATLATWIDARTYVQDVHETIVDLLGLEDARASLPFASLVQGRSLLRRRGLVEPMALLATSTGVWEPDDARFGVMRGDDVLFGPPGEAWSCFDLSSDPTEHTALPPSACGQGMIDVAKRSWPDALSSTQ